MTIKEIYGATKKRFNETPFQMVLKFSNDTDVIITDADMEEGSRFIRNSKRRLTEEFDIAVVEADMTVYRTHTEDKTNQYYLIVGTDFEMVKQYSRKSYKEVKEDVAEKEAAKPEFEPGDGQMITDMNMLVKMGLIPESYIAPPTHEMHLSIGSVQDGTYFVRLKMDSKVWTSHSYEFKDDIWKYQFYGVLFGMKVALKANGVQKLFIHPNTGRNSAGVYKIPAGQWRPYGNMKDYKAEVLRMKDLFAKKGVSLIFCNESGEQI